MQKRTILIVIIVTTIIIATIFNPAWAADGNQNDSLTRGGRFSITITGNPNTLYYIWLTRTFTMTGKSGDQPPIIVAYQNRVQQDPPGGPYTIGNYAFNNGNGRTILDDVAPSTTEMSNTNYYALVATDSDGRAVVAFQTSQATATRTFSIKVENPQSAANNNIQVERGLPPRVLTTEATEFPTTFPAIPAIEVTSKPSSSPAYIINETIAQPVQTTSQKSPPWLGYCFLSVGAGYGLVRKRSELKSFPIFI
ncbi:MAG: hypothetical protein LUQ54_04100, partial [Methanoregula sp.]|nr:hypothetical protein [Methanoregula sp.]